MSIKQLNQYDIEKQEHLNLSKLKLLNGAKHSVTRPLNSVIDVMNWAFENFESTLQDKININKFVQNYIIMNGQFIQYCNDYNINIKTLYKESIISNQTNNGFESFSVQGVFLIKSKDIEFILCNLVYKSTQYSDEVCNFVLVSEKNYDSFLTLRNEFYNWSYNRDRDTSYIKVINGKDLIYDKEYTWNDIFLPSDLKKEIKESVEEFLNSKDFYLKNNIPWKRGMLISGPPGVGKTTLIKTIISEYDFKPVTIHSNVNDDVVSEAFSYAEEHSPALLYFEDLDALLESNLIDLSLFLNLMDGICATNGILVIATVKNINDLQNSIADRPSRFDRKYHIPLPNQKMILDYLNKKFGTLLSKEKCINLAKVAEKNNFSYTYLKELYISSFSKAISNNRKKPNFKDIDMVMNLLTKNKNNLNSGVNTNKYL